MLFDGRILAAGGTDYYNDTCVDWNATLPPGIAPFPAGRGRARGDQERAHLRSRHQRVDADRLDGVRALVSRRGDAARRRRLHRERRHAAGQARLPRQPDGLRAATSSRPRPTTRPAAPGRPTRRPPIARCRCSRACTCSRTGASSSTPAGQAFNPFGQAYDMLLWNFVASYDPVTQTWTDHGVAGVPGHRRTRSTRRRFRARASAARRSR